MFPSIAQQRAERTARTYAQRLKNWFEAVHAGYAPTYTDAVNRQQRHCRIGRIKPSPTAWAEINGGLA